jgi:hypothetical protein
MTFKEIGNDEAENFKVKGIFRHHTLKYTQHIEMMYILGEQWEAGNLDQVQLLYVK